MKILIGAKVHSDHNPVMHAVRINNANYRESNRKVKNRKLNEPKQIEIFTQILYEALVSV